MQTTMNSNVEKSLELSSAAETGNRFFRSLDGSFAPVSRFEWTAQAPSPDAGLMLTVRYRPESGDPPRDLELTTQFEKNEIQDPLTFQRHLEKAWSAMLSKIGSFYSSRARELVAAMDEE